MMLSILPPYNQSRRPSSIYTQRNPNRTDLKKREMDIMNRTMKREMKRGDGGGSWQNTSDFSQELMITIRFNWLSSYWSQFNILISCSTISSGCSGSGQGVVRSTQWIKSGGRWALKRKGKTLSWWDIPVCMYEVCSLIRSMNVMVQIKRGCVIDKW